ncbi:MAG: hypothetical protein R3F34_02190 [Planctomycetota bacterium]
MAARATERLGEGRVRFGAVPMPKELRREVLAATRERDTELRGLARRQRRPKRIDLGNGVALMLLTNGVLVDDVLDVLLFVAAGVATGLLWGALRAGAIRAGTVAGAVQIGVASIGLARHSADGLGTIWSTALLFGTAFAALLGSQMGFEREMRRLG